MNKYYKCRLCRFKSLSSEKYVAHLEGRHLVKYTNLDGKFSLENACFDPIIEVVNFNSEVSDFINEVKNDEFLTCKFCGHEFSRKNNLTQHLKKCKAKKENDKEQELKKIKLENEKLQMEIKELQEIKEEKKLLEEEYHDLLKQCAKNYVNNPPTTVNGSNNAVNSHNTTNNNTINMFYIVNNFKDALNFDDCMGKALTDEEIKFIQKNGPSAGLYKLLADRCVDNMDISKRPIHLVDLSRKKYMIKNEDDWHVDLNGKTILKKTYPQVEKAYMPELDLENPTKGTIATGEDAEKRIDKINNLMKMRDTGERTLGRLDVNVK